MLYQNASNKRDLCRGEDICDNWVRILGATSGELDHDKDIGSRELDNLSLGSGFYNNPKVAAATAQNDDDDRLADKQANSEEVDVVDAATVHPVNANHVHPQLLPTFVGGRPSGNVATGSVVLAMTSDARGGGGQGGRVGGRGAGCVDPPWQSPSLLESSRGGEYQKTKNSTNCEQGSISKAINGMAELIETGASGSESRMI